MHWDKFGNLFDKRVRHVKRLRATGLCKIHRVSENAVQECRNQCRNDANVGLMMWAIAQET